MSPNNYKGLFKMKGQKNNSLHVPQAFIDMIGDHFLEAARYLRETQDAYPDEFVAIAKDLGIGRRNARACRARKSTSALLGVP